MSPIFAHEPVPIEPWSLDWKPTPTNWPLFSGEGSMAWTVWVPHEVDTLWVVTEVWPNGGCFDVFIDGVLIGEHDFYSATPATRSDTLEGFTIEGGRYVTVMMRRHPKPHHPGGNQMKLHSIGWARSGKTIDGYLAVNREDVFFSPIGVEIPHALPAGQYTFDVHGAIRPHSGE